MTESLRKIWNIRPLIISGPCSAETEEQVMRIASDLAETGRVHLFRSGIWKPRTKPGMFEGVGNRGLEWLRNVKKETGLHTTIEVATALHVEEALKYGIDVLWIGARTTVNPFSVQEIADALKGINIPVLVKNPVSPDPELWSGAIERMQKAGLQDIGMVHRGFSSYAETEYRNAPMWHLPIEMKRRYPELMMICDPSHISGNRSLLQSVAQKSIDLDFDGLMIESHPDPDNALTDAKQQITSPQLEKLLDSLIWRVRTEKENSNELASLRRRIDQVDDELLTLLSKRMKIADLIGVYKKENNITILQAERWNEILDRALDKGQQLLLSKDFLTKYFDAVHMESINHQNKVMNDKNKQG